MLIHSFKIDGVEGDFNSVLVYKPQKKPTVVGIKGLDLKHSDDLFVLGIQTREQYKMMLQGSQVVLCMDATHCTNQYDFQLLNLVVPDEFKIGYPVAH